MLAKRLPACVVRDEATDGLHDQGPDKQSAMQGSQRADGIYIRRLFYAFIAKSIRKNRSARQKPSGIDPGKKTNCPAFFNRFARLQKNKHRRRDATHRRRTIDGIAISHC